MTSLTPEHLQLREQLLANELLQKWTLKLVVRAEELESLPEAAKLVILSGDFLPQWKTNELRGPYLPLPLDGGSDIEGEITAAVAAMEPARDEPDSSSSEWEK